MRKFHLVIFVHILLSSHALADIKLQCAGVNNEQKMLRQAPSGATRLNKNTLQINYSGGAKRFSDKPPHEALSGEHWRYCGYDESAKLHLIHHQTNGTFSGLILFEETGKILAAGHAVIFSPDKLKFLSIVQEDGMDGENWAVFDISGKKLWGGYAGILSIVAGKNYESVSAQYENPSFGSNQDISANVVCSNKSNRGTVTLTRVGDHWKWLPEIKC